MVEVNRLLPGQGSQGQVAATTKKGNGEGALFDLTKESKETLEELVEGKAKRSESTRLSRAKTEKTPKNFLVPLKQAAMDDDNAQSPLEFFIKIDPKTGQPIALRLLAVA